MMEELILLHLLNGMDGDVITVCSFWNVIMCKTTTRRMKTTVSLVIRCYRSVNQSLGWTGQMRALTSLHSTTSSSYTTLATTTHNKKYLGPYVFALA
jgi:hypothetical protein